MPLPEKHFHVELAFPDNPHELELLKNYKGPGDPFPVCKRLWGEPPPRSILPTIMMVHEDDCPLHQGEPRCTCPNWDEDDD